MASSWFFFSTHEPGTLILPIYLGFPTHELVIRSANVTLDTQISQLLTEEKQSKGHIPTLNTSGHMECNRSDSIIYATKSLNDVIKSHQACLVMILQLRRYRNSKVMALTVSASAMTPPSA